MLLLVMGDNLLVLFIGWEGVGLCSYLLIGFWYHDHANTIAGIRLSSSTGLAISVLYSGFCCLLRSWGGRVSGP